MLLAIFLLVVIGTILWARWPRTRDFAPPTENAKLLRPTLPQTGKHFFEIVGESNYQPALRRLAREAKSWAGIASLTLENTNPHDGQAVRVDIDGATVGYLSREDARTYRKRLLRYKVGPGPHLVSARAHGGGDKNYGVWLDLPDRLS